MEQVQKKPVSFEQVADIYVIEKFDIRQAVQASKELLSTAESLKAIKGLTEIVTDVLK